MRVTVVGTGYVGLVTAACLADRGHRVVCVDVDPARVDQVSRGEVPFFERGLDPLLKRNLGRGLSATTDLAAAVAGSDLSLICVPTPSRDGEIDLSAVRAAAGSLGAALARKDDYHVVVVKSTVVPGTTDEVVLPALEEASGKKAGPDFGVGMNPEFLTEGRAIEDFLAPDRIVLGGRDEDTVAALEQLYADFADVPAIRTDNRTAEMIKYTSNVLLAASISFANEIADLCASLGIDAMEVMRAVHRSRYLTTRLPDGTEATADLASFLEPGCGFGGSCLPKDLDALIGHGERHGRPMDLLKAVRGVNQGRPEELVSVIRRHLPDLRGVSVTVLGLAFRPDTDDIRESPALPVIHRLVEEGAVVTAHDPVARPDLNALFPSGSVRLEPNLAQAVRGPRAVVLVTRWEDYRALPDLLREVDPAPVFVDGRRMLDPRAFDRYDGIGL
jgi:UDPglucose 6-dehydrogenase